MRKLLLPMAVVCACFGAYGCTATVDNPSPPPAVVVEPTNPIPSTLNVRWTIAQSLDPNECIRSVVQNIEISVRDTNGFEVGAFQQDCRTFATSITLNPGSYTGTAVLLDAVGNRRTTEVQITPFTLRGNDVLNVDVDFPSDSFF